jgi:dTDP-4-dehydrorhamnose reductase
MARLLVTGATGLLGCALVPALLAQGHEVLRHGHSAIADFNADLTEAAQTAAMLGRARPEVIINLAALANVDACQTDINHAYRMNVLTVENLCREIDRQASPAHLVQISSDMVYDGTGPHSEDQISPCNVYALSKIAGELAASRVASTVLRTNFFGRSRCPGRSSLSDWLYQSLRTQSPIQVFDDVLFAPLSLPTLCGLLQQIAVKRPIGVFNLGARDGMSKADFAYAFAAALEMPSQTLQRAGVGAMGSLKARRPTDMRMDCRRIEAVMQLRLPSLLDEINLTRNEYHENP